jgi:hypothetical protein
MVTVVPVAGEDVTSIWPLCAATRPCRAASGKFRAKKRFKYPSLGSFVHPLTVCGLHKLGDMHAWRGGDLRDPPPHPVAHTLGYQRH